LESTGDDARCSSTSSDCARFPSSANSFKRSKTAREQREVQNSGDNGRHLHRRRTEPAG
jgi:hypothetical protein